MMVGSKMMEPDSRQWRPMKGQEAMGTSSLPLKQKKKLSYGVRAQALGQVIPAGCGVFILGAIQNSARQCPEQPTVADIALSRGFGLDHLKRSFPTPITLILSYHKKLNGFSEAVEQIREH